jgi:hypothetical protein
MGYSLRHLWTDRTFVREVYRGWRQYVETGETPDSAYQALIRLHCRSNGMTTDILADLVRRFRHPIALDPNIGVLATMSNRALSAAATTLREDGFVIFDAKLPAETCTDLVQFAQTTLAEPEGEAGERREPIVYDRAAPLSRRYNFKEQAVIERPAVQRLMADESLLSFAQQYFRAAPLLDFMVLWWSTVFSELPGSQAAQLFHFDFDRVKWLKVFFYLTDVTDERGPHCFVKGSHRRGHPGAERLLARGYARLTDEEVISAFGRESIASITGKAGTIIAVDTRGFHKGIVPKTGDRLVLQFQYATSPFGGSVPRSHLGSDNIVVPDLQNLVARHPSIFGRFLQGNAAVGKPR